MVVVEGDGDARSDDAFVVGVSAIGEEDAIGVPSAAFVDEPAGGSSTIVPSPVVASLVDAAVDVATDVEGVEFVVVVVFGVKLAVLELSRARFPPAVGVVTSSPSAILRCFDARTDGECVSFVVVELYVDGVTVAGVVVVVVVV